MKNKKIILSIGTIALAISPVAVAVSCSTWTGQKPKAGTPLDLTSAPVGTWHALFHDGGRSIPSDGQILKVEVGGKNVTYIWNHHDSKAETPYAYLESSVAYGTMLSYLAQRFATAEGVDAAAVYAAFGVGGHGINPASMPSASMVGQSTDPKDNATVQITGEEVAYAIDGIWGWHQLFYAGLPAGGTKIYLPLNSTIVRDSSGNPIKPAYNKNGVATNKPVPADGYAVYRAHFNGELAWAVAKEDDLLNITWGGKDAATQVAQDYLAGLASQGKMVNYIQNKFIAAYPGKLDAIKTYIKENSGGHDIWDELGQTVDRTTVATFDLSTASPSTRVRLWHFAFANKTGTSDSTRYGRSLPLVGDTFNFTIGEVTYSFKWDERDSETTQGWLTNDWNQYQVVEYVAARLMKGNIAAQNEVLKSMTMQHIADGGNGSYPWTHLLTPDNDAGKDHMVLEGRDQWHRLFKTGVPVVGQKIRLNTANYHVTNNPNPTLLAEYVWTEADSLALPVKAYINDSTQQTGVVNYVSQVMQSKVTSTVDKAAVADRIRVISGGHLIWQTPENTILRTKPFDGVAEHDMYNNTTPTVPNENKYKGKIDLRDGMLGVKYVFNETTRKYESKIQAQTTSSNSGMVDRSWHNAFALEGGDHTGRTLPVIGDIFKYGEKEYTWTQADTDYMIQRGWQEYRMSIYDTVEYVAGKVAGENINIKHGIYDRMTRTSHQATSGPKPASWTRPTGYTTIDLTAKGETEALWYTPASGTGTSAVPASGVIPSFKYGAWFRVTSGSTPVNYDVYLTADYFNGYLNKPSAVAPTNATEKAAWIASWKAFVVMVMSDAYNGLTEAAAWTAMGLTKPA